jgi:hypothetical protein
VTPIAIPSAARNRREVAERRAQRVFAAIAIPGLDLASLPARVDRAVGAAVLSRLHGTPFSPRSLEKWPLSWVIVNGRATCCTADLLTEANERVDAAAAVRGGRIRTRTLVQRDPQSAFEGADS